MVIGETLSTATPEKQIILNSKQRCLLTCGLSLHNTIFKSTDHLESVEPTSYLTGLPNQLSFLLSFVLKYRAVVMAIQS
jgi:hypothetical protein